MQKSFVWPASNFQIKCEYILANSHNMHKAEVWHYRADIKQRYSMFINQKKTFARRKQRKTSLQQHPIPELKHKKSIIYIKNTFRRSHLGHLHSIQEREKKLMSHEKQKWAKV